jgi:hypothetical protein
MPRIPAVSATGDQISVSPGSAVTRELVELRDIADAAANLLLLIDHACVQGDLITVERLRNGTCCTTLRNLLKARGR